jgi:hypothetical protein
MKTAEETKTYTVQHTAISNFPFWYHLDSHRVLESAVSRARNYALDHGGYVCVMDETGKTGLWYRSRRTRPRHFQRH